jgi:hypothetical protein
MFPSLFFKIKEQKNHFLKKKIYICKLQVRVACTGLYDPEKAPRDTRELDVSLKTGCATVKQESKQ